MSAAVRSLASPSGRIQAAFVVSVSGDSLRAVAFPIATWRATGGDALAVGAVAATEAVLMLAWGLVAGVWADCLSHRRVTAVTDGARALAMAVLAAGALSGAPPVVLLYAVSVVLGLMRVHWFASAVPALAFTTPASLRARVQGNLVAAESVAATVGPLAAGVVIAHVGVGAVFAFDAATFLVSAVLFASIRQLDGIERAASSLPGPAATCAAVRDAVARTVACAPVMAVAPASVAVHLCALALAPVLVPRVLDAPGGSPGAFGVVLACSGAAAALAALACRSVSASGPMVVWGAVVCAVGFAVVAVMPGVASAALGAGLVGAGAAVTYTHQGALVMASFAVSELGRVSGVLRTVMRGSVFVGAAGGGALAAVGSGVPFVAAAGLCAAGAAVSARSRARLGGAAELVPAAP